MLSFFFANRSISKDVAKYASDLLDLRQTRDVGVRVDPGLKAGGFGNGDLTVRHNCAGEAHHLSQGIAATHDRFVEFHVCPIEVVGPRLAALGGETLSVEHFGTSGP